MELTRFDIRSHLGYTVRMKPLPKQTAALRDPEYLAYVRTLPCRACGLPPYTDFPSHAHHQPPVGGSSIGLKCPDYRAVPLCGRCHCRYHQRGRLSFWGERDVEGIIFELQQRYFFG